MNGDFSGGNLTPAERALGDFLRGCSAKWYDVWRREGRIAGTIELQEDAETVVNAAATGASEPPLLAGRRLVSLVVPPPAPPRPQLPDVCIVAVPAPQTGASVIFSVDAFGHLLVTRRAFPAGQIKADSPLAKLPVWGLSKFGPLRYEVVGTALAPAAIPAEDWLLLDADRLEFQKALRFSGLLFLVAGGAAWVPLARTGGPGDAVAALVVVAGVVLTVVGEFFKSRRIWLKKIARWTALAAPTMVIELATALVTVGIQHPHVPSDVPQFEAIIGSVFLVVGGFSLWGFIRLWPLSRSCRCSLTAPCPDRYDCHGR